MDRVYEVGLEIIGEKPVDAELLAEECRRRVDEAIEQWGCVFGVAEGELLLVRRETLNSEEEEKVIERGGRLIFEGEPEQPCERLIVGSEGSESEGEEALPGTQWLRA